MGKCKHVYWLELYFSPSCSLVFNKFREDLGAGPCARDGQENREDPRNGREDTDGAHAILEQFEGKMFLPALQQVEGLAECKITHDIEAVEVEPETRIDGLVGEIVQLSNQLVHIAIHTAFIVP